jgi:hypothetical protein
MSDRALHFLALRYGVSHHTIQHAVWSRRPPADAPGSPFA